MAIHGHGHLNHPIQMHLSVPVLLIEDPAMALIDLLIVTRKGIDIENDVIESQRILPVVLDLEVFLNPPCLKIVL